MLTGLQSELYAKGFMVSPNTPSTGDYKLMYASYRGIKTMESGKILVSDKNIKVVKYFNDELIGYYNSVEAFFADCTSESLPGIPAFLNSDID